MYNPILGMILIIIGSLIALVSLGDLIVRIAIAVFGLYLIYNGMKMRGQGHKVNVIFHRFRDRF